MAPEKDKKRLFAAAPAKARAPGPEVAAEKARLGALMRPEPAEKSAGIEVGAAHDAAERDADKVADALVAAPAAPGEAEGQARDEEDAPSAALARGPPVLGVDPRRRDDAPLVRRSADPASQPNLDSLNAVPALPSNLVEVDVAPEEESDLGAFSRNDIAVLSQGASVQARRVDSAGPGRFSLARPVADRIRAPASTGERLPSSLRHRFEARLGRDLAGVRVHDGREAAELCGHVGAKAFAFGARIFLRSPSLRADARLMAHEIAHTVQQGAAPRLGRTARPQAAFPLPRRAARAPPRPRGARSRAPRAPPGKSASDTSDSPSSAAPAAGVVRRLAEGESDPGVLARGAEEVADRLDSYGVLKVLIGRRLFTGETINPGAMDYVGAFMKFIGADETFEQMKQSGALQKGFDAIRNGLVTHNLTWERVRQTFSRARDEFDWWEPIDSFTRIFGPFFSDVLSFGALVLKVVAELVAEAFMINFGPQGREVWQKIKGIGDSIELIVADPLGFAMNLMRAVGRGIQGFGERIWEHIKSGLLAWLLGPLADMGVQLPERLDLRGIISVVLQVLGLTYPQLRPRIVRALNPNGEVKVSVVERLVEVVNILRTEGLAGLWRKLLDYVQNLQTTVMAAIRDWAIGAIVQAGIRKLVAWTNPAGALIDILLTIYNLIVFFVERFQQILAFAASVFDSLGKIARGELSEAAVAVEGALARTIPIILSFMTRLLGLPDIAGAVRRLITNVRARIHAAFDRMLGWIVDKVKKLIAGLIARFSRRTSAPQDTLIMQGDPHTMSLEEVNGQRRLVIRTEPTVMTSQYLNGQCDIMQRICEPPITSILLPNLRACATSLATLEQQEAAASRQPRPNQDAPDLVERRRVLLAEIKRLMQEGTKKEVLTDQERQTGEVNPDTKGGSDEVKTHTVPEHQKDQVKPDLDSPAFRFVLLNENVDGEGFAGPWSQAKAKREEIKAAFTSGDDDKSAGAKYLIELDHNPEHQILWRLAFLEVDPPQPERVDDAATPAKKEPERLFPGLSAQYSREPAEAGSYDRDGGPGVMALATRREVNTAEINKQDANRAALLAAAPWKAQRKRFVKDPAQALPDFKTSVIAAAGEHRNALVANYQRYLTAKDADQPTFDAIQRNGQTIIDVTKAYFEGMTLTGPMLAGAGSANLSATGMRADPVDAELVHGAYSTTLAARQAKQFGNALETHHVIEQRVIDAVREEAEKSVNLVDVMRGDAAALHGFAAPGQKPYELLESLLATRTKAGGAAIPPATEKQQLSAAAPIMLVSGFNTAKDTLADGFAINVLRQVNQLAGAQSPATAVATIRAGRTAALTAAHAKAIEAINSAYGALPATGVTPEQLAQARVAAKTAYAGAAAPLATAGLRPSFSQAIDTAATTAYATFRRLQDESMNRIFPAEEAAKAYDDNPATNERPRVVLQNLRQRSTALTEAVVTTQNRSIWLT